MCGFFLVCERNSPVDRARFRAALNSMAHRGPDANGIHIETLDYGDERVTVALGHRRLAIIDLAARSEQPFAAPRSRMIYNGEIFNFRDLAARMPDHDLVTTGDTEVLAHWIDRKGIEGFSALNGQWASAHYFPAEAKIVLGRDFFGEKPLFLYRDAQRFIASSTIRALALYLGERLTPRSDFIHAFVLSHGAFLPAHETHLKEVAQLAPGHVGTMNLREWAWSTRLVCERPRDGIDVTGARAVEQLYGLIEETVLSRLISDREVGLFISGGIDSTLILSILHRHNALDAITCVIGNTEGSPDPEYAKAITSRLGVAPKLVPMDYSAASFDQFLNVFHHQERPFALHGNLVAVPQLYTAIAHTGIKVVLDGTGADEIFGGYWDRYAPFAVREAFSRGHWLWIAGLLCANTAEVRRIQHVLRLAWRGRHASGYTGHARFLGISPGRCRELAARFDPLNDISGTLADAQVNDMFRGRLQDWLWQNDRNAMAHSIEARSPFMDRRLFPYVDLPLDRKFRGAFNKFLLRQVFDCLGGSETQWRRQKQGFRYRADKFLVENREHIVDFIAASAILAEQFPGVTIDNLRAAETPLALLGRLFAIAASEPAYDGVSYT